MILKGKTLKGKNRVRELGAEWRVIRTEESLAFGGHGPWALVEPVAHPGPDKSRWIKLVNDTDFEVTNG